MCQVPRSALSTAKSAFVLFGIHSVLLSPKPLLIKSLFNRFPTLESALEGLHAAENSFYSISLKRNYPSHICGEYHFSYLFVVALLLLPTSLRAKKSWKRGIAALLSPFSAERLPIPPVCHRQLPVSFRRTKGFSKKTKRHRLAWLRWKWTADVSIAGDEQCGFAFRRPITVRSEHNRNKW